MRFITTSNRAARFAMLLTLLVAGNIFAQTTWEFSGTSYAFQKAHFDSATNTILNKLGIQMRTFGAPYNQIDTTFIRVFGENSNYKVLLFGQENPSPSSGQINLTNRVNIESATGVPDSATFVTDYLSHKAAYTDYMVMQGHPYAWTTQAKKDEFQKILNYLVADSVVFTTPYGYYRYLNDMSIPRTSKVQVILKLDDLRATSYFNPSIAVYDILVTRKIKASFGVNNMGGITQAQIDTLNYYLRQTNTSGDTLFELWNHGLDHSMTASTSGGNWSNPSSWPSGYVPGEDDDVTIPTGVTVTLDIPDAVCRNLTITGTLTALNTDTVGLTVNGDLQINSGGTFTSPSLTGATSNIFHSLTIYGNFTNAGGTFDFRAGSAGTTLRAINTTFTGSSNSTITVGTYTSTNNDFNSITINKAGGARVICGSDVVIDPGSSLGTSQLILTNGIVETGSYTLYALSTTSNDVVTASSASYINGALGRGMSNSAGKTNSFAVGDSYGYRPLTLKSTTSGVATGHHVIVRVVHANANPGGSAFTNGIDTVSRVRYYQISYNKGIGSGATSMSFNSFSPSYGTDDGVVAGNTNLRVAYSTDERATWNGMNQTTAHTTSLTTTPRTITPSDLGSVVTLNSGSGYIYVALAKVTGTYTNPLPVELTGFSATVSGNTVRLSWNTATEHNSAQFSIERQAGSSQAWLALGTIAAAGNSNSPHVYAYRDANAGSGEFRYRLKMTDSDGSFTYSNELQVTVGVPTAYSLEQNYPNPFNPETRIAYAIPEPGRAVVRVYSVTGQLVKTLTDEYLPAGFYAVSFSAPELASGVYVYSLTINNKQITRRMLLLK